MYLKESVNSIKASWLELWLANLIGKKSTHYSFDDRVTIAVMPVTGKRYFLESRPMTDIEVHAGQLGILLDNGRLISNGDFFMQKTNGGKVRLRCAQAQISNQRYCSCAKFYNNIEEALQDQSDLSDWGLV